MSAQFNKQSLRCTMLLGAAVVLSACSIGASPRLGPAATAVAPVQETGAAPVIASERALRVYDRALAAMRAANWLEAELELEQLVLEYPDLAGPYVNLAIVYMRDNREDDAAEALERALAIDPAHVAANNQFAILLRAQGRFEEAEQAYRRALQSDPAYALAYYNLGVLLDLYLGRQGEALAYYEQYQDLLAEPDRQVGRWIVDLRRRLGVNENPRVAQGDGA